MSHVPPTAVSPSSAPTSKRIITSSKTPFHFAAGLASGLTSSILLQPADLLKTRVQQQSKRTASLLDTIRTILSSPHPIRNLWRGTLPSALRTGFGSALYFTSLNALRQEVARRGPVAILLDGNSSNSTVKSSSALPKLSHTANLLTGAVARTAAGFIMMPVTVLKVRYESDYYAYRSLAGAAKDIVRTEGVKGLFAGFGATAVRDAPYAGLYVAFYEQFKRTLSRIQPSTASADTDKSNNNKSNNSTTINFASGALAAGLATALTNPFDAVKTRIQLQPGKYRNMVHALRLMIKEDGGRSLMSGLGLRMGRKALSSALAWSVYEELIMRAERRWEAEAREMKY
ncbi:mitochondrial carrier protein, putative [Talaromyces stipitatus ATCC 10500]|uniref:Mitochondrial glycine transporter n=1 Tax=Talaromyces stipitatus (strain ATCC 10500 / CBS 375.48 / QM 6759 / NRRL 1006) TaxID=441959 RepID=B8LWI2_TALSN|nr:mitochondrial carrier protein, putative [Talaromyces stipitatus ATCC 10500]EED24293.1 mitochondrial carrier protein, putative [Talaromyces stipitatus ATCC 10500]